MSENIDCGPQECGECGLIISSQGPCDRCRELAALRESVTLQKVERVKLREKNINLGMDLTKSLLEADSLREKCERLEGALADTNEELLLRLELLRDATDRAETYREGLEKEEQRLWDEINKENERKLMFKRRAETYRDGIETIRQHIDEMSHCRNSLTEAIDYIARETLEKGEKG